MDKAKRQTSQNYAGDILDNNATLLKNHSYEETKPITTLLVFSTFASIVNSAFKVEACLQLRFNTVCPLLKFQQI